MDISMMTINNKICDNTYTGEFRVRLISNKRGEFINLSLDQNQNVTSFPYPGGGRGVGHSVIYKQLLKAFYE